MGALDAGMASRSIANGAISEYFMLFLIARSIPKYLHKVIKHVDAAEQSDTTLIATFVLQGLQSTCVSMGGQFIPISTWTS